jgi:hypothetical protein
MEFYFPTSGKVTYNIIYEWGEYIITTEGKPNAIVHEDSKPYLGYITFRPMLSKSFPDQKQSFYLITPTGEVWENKAGQSIPEFSKRQEVTKEKTKFSTTTKTLEIESTSEAIINHFRANPGQWSIIGKLKCYGGKTHLKLASSI